MEEADAFVPPIGHTKVERRRCYPPERFFYVQFPRIDVVMTSMTHQHFDLAVGYMRLGEIILNANARVIQLRIMRHVGLGRFPEREGTLDPFHRIAKHGKAVKFLRLRWHGRSVGIPLMFLDAPVGRFPRPVESHPGVIVKQLVGAPLLDGIVLDEIVFDQIGTFGQLGILGENFGAKVQPQRVEEGRAAFLDVQPEHILHSYPASLPNVSRPYRLWIGSHQSTGIAFCLNDCHGSVGYGFYPAVNLIGHLMGAE
mmetsp:Transcript_10212/g.28642  ORF Transcript_10212/g.28642 Transcript_10212/m.28642 type:complete len:255 (+) Transcript_10212:226-990(+)